MLEEKEGLRVLTIYICLDLNLVYFYMVYYASLLVVSTGIPVSIWNQARGFLLLRSLRSLVTHKAPIKVNQCIKCPCESSLGDLNIMQQLAQETKDTIASYLHSKSDLASLTMVDRAFASAGRRARFRTVHISESSPSRHLSAAMTSSAYTIAGTWEQRCQLAMQSVKSFPKSVGMSAG